MPSYRTLVLVAALPLLGACAPDAWKSSSPYDAWLNQVSNACYNQGIGSTNVGTLIDGVSTPNGGYFMDQTSRLYAGQITRSQWMDGMSGFLMARPSDPGVNCVLNLLPQK